MGSNVSITKLNDVLTLSKVPMTIDPFELYKQVTVRLFHKGLVLREEKIGQEIQSNQWIVSKGQFVISRIDARNGAMGIIPEELDGAIVTNDFLRYDIDTDQLDPEFFDYLTSMDNFVHLCARASEGTTNRKRLRPDLFLNIEIPIPPLKEQQKIAYYLSRQFSRLYQLKQLKKEYKISSNIMLNNVFLKIIHNAKFEKMKDVAPCVRRKIDIDINAEYPELGVRSFGKGTFHKPSIQGAEIVKKLFKIESRDLIFNNVFAWEGAVAVAKPEDDCRFGSHRFISCVPDTRIATSNFLNFYFLTSEGLKKLGDASPGGALRNRTLGLKALENIEVPTPDINEQLWFDRLQAKVDEVKLLQEETEREMEALVPAVLAKAFGG